MEFACESVVSCGLLQLNLKCLQKIFQSTYAVYSKWFSLSATHKPPCLVTWQALGARVQVSGYIGDYVPISASPVG
jgi:hypothetical protein